MSKQPAYINIKKRAVCALENSDKVMNDSFWVGVWPGLNQTHLIYISSKIKLYIQNHAK